MELPRIGDAPEGASPPPLSGPPPLPAALRPALPLDYASPGAPLAAEALRALESNPSAPVLLPEHWRQLGEARRRGKRLRRAIAVSDFYAWATTLFGALSLTCLAPSLLGFSPAGLGVGVAMLAIGIAEFLGARRLRETRPGAARFLAFNHAAFSAMLAAYGLWMLHATATAPLKMSSDMAQLSQLGGDVAGYAEMAKPILYAVYGGIVLAAIFGEGAVALWFFMQEKRLREYVAETPPWALRMLQVMERL